MEGEKKNKSKNIVKIVFENEVRKYRNVNSYKDLILSIARTLGYGVLNCRFVYMDDDKDEITVSNEEDLQEAFNFFSPKPPRLELVTYNEQVDVSLSQIKLCDSMLQESDNEDNKEVSEDQPKEEKPKDLPLQMETEDRPRQMQIESVESQEQAIQPEEKKEEIDEEQTPNAEIQHISDEPVQDEQHKDNKEIEVLEPISIEADVKQEDRIRPALFVEHSDEEEIINTEKVPQNKIMNTDSLLNFDELKSKISDLVKKELSTLLPEMLKQTTSLSSEQKLLRDNNKYAEVVHNFVMCSN